MCGFRVGVGCGGHDLLDDASRYDDSTSVSLLARLRIRDPDAWVRFSRIYGPLVYRWCRRAGVRTDDVADIVQEVFRGVAAGIDRFRRERTGDSFRGWLFGITRNRICDHFRHVSAGPQVVGGTALQQKLEELPACEELLADDVLRDDDQTLVVRQALALIQDEFEEKNWQAFWRTTVERETSSEVAVSLGMTAGAVRQAKFRVMRRLRRELADLDDL